MIWLEDWFPKYWYPRDNYDFILPGITANVVSSGTAEVVVIETTHWSPAAMKGSHVLSHQVFKFGYALRHSSREDSVPSTQSSPCNQFLLLLYLLVIVSTPLKILYTSTRELQTNKSSNKIHKNKLNRKVLTNKSNRKVHTNKSNRKVFTNKSNTEHTCQPSRD